MNSVSDIFAKKLFGVPVVSFPRFTENVPNMIQFASVDQENEDDSSS